MSKLSCHLQKLGSGSTDENMLAMDHDLWNLDLNCSRYPATFWWVAWSTCTIIVNRILVVQ